MYRRLDPNKLIETVEVLYSRISQRFPDSDLRRVCLEFLALAKRSPQRAEAISRNSNSLRIAVGMVVLLLLGALIGPFFYFKLPGKAPDLGNFVQVLEAGVNVLVVLGGAILFLITVEARIKRNRALRALNELRALAHVVDLHQISKNPERLRGVTKDKTHVIDMTPAELIRYLNYCNEMVALISILAAIYTLRFQDAVVLAALNEIEGFSSGLSSKIWQKIMVVHTVKPNRKR